MVNCALNTVQVLNNSDNVNILSTGVKENVSTHAHTICYSGRETQQHRADHVHKSVHTHFKPF